MIDASSHGMDGLPQSQFHAIVMCRLCPRTPVGHVPGLNIKPGHGEFLDWRGGHGEILGNCWEL
jgi:hypothetical protein